VDVFDALVSVRPYKGPWQTGHAVEEIRKGSGVHFDPKVAATFLEMLERGELDDLIAAATAAPPPAEPDHPATGVVSH
jgi:putative two-component system response regulator